MENGKCADFLQGEVALLEAPAIPRAPHDYVSCSGSLAANPLVICLLPFF